VSHGEAQVQNTLSKLKRGEHVTIVVLGDSNTAEGFHTRGRMGWISLLAEAIFETYGTGVCTLINAAVCGTGFAEAGMHLERDVFRYQPDLVIIGFGVWGANLGLEKLEQFKDDMRGLIRAIRERHGCEILVRTPNPVVAVHGVPLPEGQKSGCPLTTKPFREYAQAQVAVARELGCAVVDHFTLWSEAKFPFRHAVADPQGLWPRMSDGLHPGALGHVAFFRDMAPLFEVPKYFPWENITLQEGNA
jgi:lysophospholipase L1-like esterase